MKKGLFTLTALFLFAYSFAQTPQAFKYQAVARDLEGNPISNQEITIRVSILSGSPEGVTVYSELHEIFTNEMGLFTLEIGNPGMVISGNFSPIGWGTSTYFLKIEIDPAGGFSFQLMGTSQLLSVPYALYAENVAHNDDAYADPENELQTLSQDGNQITLSNGGGTVTVSGIDNDTLNEIQHLAKNGNIITLSKDGGSFTDENTTYQAGSGLQLNGTTFINSAPDQTVSILAGNGISRSGAYPSFIITNTKPDQTVTLQGTGAATVSGTYPNFTVNANPNDTSAINELQTITKVGDVVTLSNNGGSFIDEKTSYLPGTGISIDANTINSVWTESNGNIYNNNSGNIGIGTDEPASSAILELNGVNKGFLPPRLTNTQILSIENPVDGLVVYNTNLQKLCVYTGSNWDCANTNFSACNGISEFEYGGQVYHTVTIGDQCWMKENLNIGTMIQIPTNQSNNGIIEKYCYDNDEANCSIFGGLYQWNEIMKYTENSCIQGICPNGWHIPTIEDWQSLIDFLGGSSIAGGKMKEASSIWESPNYNATNSSGFTGLPGGYSSTSGFNSYRQDGKWWSSYNTGSLSALALTITYQNSTSFVGSNPLEKGLSIRCLKDSNSVSSFIVTPINQNINFSNGTTTFDIVSNSSWSIEENLDWISTSPLNGNGNLTITVSYSDNLSPDSRIGLISIIASGGCPIETLTLTQAGIPELWSCGYNITDERDGQVYSTVLIGTQCWMAKNLNIGNFVQNYLNQSNNGKIEKYCYNNLESYCNIYGGLYQWNEMMQYSTTPGVQGICPTGWHLPTDEEWCTLTKYLDSWVNCSSTAHSGMNVGDKMKEAGNVHWNYPSDATNSSGFTGLPGGLSSTTGFGNIGEDGFWWSSSQNNTLDSWIRSLRFNDSYIHRYARNNSDGISVRCLKDN